MTIVGRASRSPQATLTILGHPSGHTTARYFLTPSGGDYVSERRFLGDEQGTDLVLTIDPGPTVWPSGFEKTPAVTAAYLIDVHQSLAHRLSWLPFVDMVFVAQKDYVDTIRDAAGHDRVLWLPLAADSPVHTGPEVERTYEVGFVGQPGQPGTLRYKTLCGVLNRFRSNEWQRYHLPDEMGQVYQQSRVVINASVNGDVNMRLFEGMAAGALVVTDRIRNGLGELFQEGVHYLGYDTPDEAQMRVAEALADDSMRLRIAAAGREAVRDHHTYAHRLDRIRDAARALGPARPAAIRSMSARGRALAYGRIHEDRREPGSVLGVMAREGVLGPLIPHASKAAARWINQRLPLTSRARAARQARN